MGSQANPDGRRIVKKKLRTMTRDAPRARLERAAYLVERTPADIEADVRAAAPPGTVAGLDITADATGLALFATVRRADEPG